GDGLADAEGGATSGAADEAGSGVLDCVDALRSATTPTAPTANASPATMAARPSRLGAGTPAGRPIVEVGTRDVTPLPPGVEPSPSAGGGGGGAAGSGGGAVRSCGAGSATRSRGAVLSGGPSAGARRSRICARRLASASPTVASTCAPTSVGEPM